MSTSITADVVGFPAPVIETLALPCFAPFEAPTPSATKSANSKSLPSAANTRFTFPSIISTFTFTIALVPSNFVNLSLASFASSPVAVPVVGVYPEPSFLIANP